MANETLTSLTEPQNPPAFASRDEIMAELHRRYKNVDDYDVQILKRERKRKPSEWTIMIFKKGSRHPVDCVACWRALVRSEVEQC